MSNVFSLLLLSLALSNPLTTTPEELPPSPPVQQPLVEQLAALLARSDQNLLFELLRQVGQSNMALLEQGLKMEKFNREVTSALGSLKTEVGSLKEQMNGLSGTMDGLSGRMDGLSGRMDGLSGLMSGRMDGLSGLMSGRIDGVTSAIAGVQGKLNTMRNEVRLISQQKLTWQNHTYDDIYQSDFAVDGVYSIVAVNTAGGGHNPVSCSGNQPNTMLILDLGAIFKIHSVRIWNRFDGCCKDRIRGVFVYAEDRLLGAITDTKRQYIFESRGEVYARKIIFNQSLANYITLLEVQVFGSGPYADDEI